MRFPYSFINLEYLVSLPLSLPAMKSQHFPESLFNPTNCQKSTALSLLSWYIGVCEFNLYILFISLLRFIERWRIAFRNCRQMRWQALPPPPQPYYIYVTCSGNRGLCWAMGILSAEISIYNEGGGIPEYRIIIHLFDFAPTPHRESGHLCNHRVSNELWFPRDWWRLKTFGEIDFALLTNICS